RNYLYTLARPERKRRGSRRRPRRSRSGLVLTSFLRKNLPPLGGTSRSMTARSVSSVLWQDGMFMWPHHMQQEDRCHAERLRLSHRWNVHHNWGVDRKS